MKWLWWLWWWLFDHPVLCFSEISWSKGCSPHHRNSSQKKPNKSHAKVHLKRKERSPKERRREMDLVGCMKEVGLGRSEAILDSRAHMDVMIQVVR